MLCLISLSHPLSLSTRHNDNDNEDEDGHSVKMMIIETSQQSISSGRVVDNSGVVSSVCVYVWECSFFLCVYYANYIMNKITFSYNIVFRLQIVHIENKYIP